MLLAAAGCGDAKLDTIAGQQAGVDDAMVQPACEDPGAQTGDPLTIGRQVIEATQQWDVALLCSLVGVPRVPHGLVRYHEALLDGLSDEVELVQQKVEAQMVLLNFDVPARGGGHRLGLAFQQQARGWVLVTTVFVAR